MVCKNCDPTFGYPGKLVQVTKETGSHGERLCSNCGERVIFDAEEFKNASQKRWDLYFHTICKSVASKSPCLSRKIGALLVRDHSIISTGYNGPPRRVSHCGSERYKKDGVLRDILPTTIYHSEAMSGTSSIDTCPRKLLGYESGTHMELCPAQHAEQNTISNAARLGVSVLGSTLYMDRCIPCKSCFGTLINAGIVEIVVEEATVYDKHTQFLIDNSKIKIREFKL